MSKLYEDAPLVSSIMTTTASEELERAVASELQIEEETQKATPDDQKD